MPNRPLRLCLISFVGFTLLGATAESKHAEVTRAIAEIDQFRQMMANTLPKGVEPTQETFIQVCKPVGGKLKALAEKTGWEIRQVAEKNRNPAHALPEDLKETYAQFLKDPSLREKWLSSTREGKEGELYVRRIDVQKSCLACHGERDGRPNFIKSGYPKDLAYGFHAGDLRGLYVVFVPQT